MLRMQEGTWRSLSSEIGKRVFAKTVGVAFTALRHVDDALGNLFARPVCWELRTENVAGCFQVVPSAVERRAHSAGGLRIETFFYMAHRAPMRAGVPGGSATGLSATDPCGEESRSVISLFCKCLRIAAVQNCSRAGLSAQRNFDNHSLNWDDRTPGRWDGLRRSIRAVAHALV
jgi:hypothetical protein